MLKTYKHILLLIIAYGKYSFSMEKQKTNMPISQIQISKFLCAFCKKQETAINKFKLCSQCKATHYCNEECQKSDWPQHKLICKGTKICKHYCDFCYRAEITSKFKVCSRCRARHYCSHECLLRDLPRHETICINPELSKKHDKEILTERKKRIEELLDINLDINNILDSIDNLNLTDDEKSEIDDEVDKVGIFAYFSNLLEDIIAAKKDQKKEFPKLVKIFAYTQKIFRHTDQDILDLQSIIHDIRFFPTRLAKETNKTFETKNLINALSIVEWTKQNGTTFKNKGYSTATENCLESLRKKLISIMKKPQTASETELFLASIYALVSQLPCLNLKDEAGFIEAINNSNYIKLIRCLKYHVIIDDLISAGYSDKISSHKIENETIRLALQILSLKGPEYKCLKKLQLNNKTAKQVFETFINYLQALKPTHPKEVNFVSIISDSNLIGVFLIVMLVRNNPLNIKFD